MKNKRKYILSFSFLIIGLFLTASIAFGDLKDTGEGNESVVVEQTHSIEDYGEGNRQGDSLLAVAEKFPLNISMMFLIPCAIALVVVLFFICKILYRLVREKLE